MKKNIHIGTSGWSYRNFYYLLKLAATKWLEGYGVLAYFNNDIFGYTCQCKKIN